MADKRRTIVRAFDGSLADAEGLLAVDKATFDECPYSAEEVQAMLSDGAQRAWLALGGDSVAGFVVAFPTTGLQGRCWEVDLLAVLPEWRGRGLATRLIRAACAEGKRVAQRARAAVATDNGASIRAFTRAGFRVGAETNKLLIYRTGGLAAHASTVRDVTIHRAASVAEAADWPPERPADQNGPGPTLLLAEQDGQPAGYAELIEVETLLYRGVWIESIQAQSRSVYEALVHEAANQAITAGLDEIGALVPDRDWPLQDSLVARGFRSLGDFYWLTAGLPLPGLAAAPDAPSPSEEQGDGVV
jgi:ribosomal protein S18 acetylase RimI-like enzyme